MPRSSSLLGPQQARKRPVPPLDSDAVPADMKDVMLSLSTIAVAEAPARRSGGRRRSRQRNIEAETRMNRRGLHDDLAPATTR